MADRRLTESSCPPAMAMAVYEVVTSGSDMRDPEQNTESDSQDHVAQRSGRLSLRTVRPAVVVCALVLGVVLCLASVWRAPESASVQPRATVGLSANPFADIANAVASAAGWSPSPAALATPPAPPAPAPAPVAVASTTPMPPTSSPLAQPDAGSLEGTDVPIVTGARTDAPAANLPAKVDGLPCGQAGDNCLQSQCCALPGFQCYQKNDDYATCRAECTPGIDPNDVAMGQPATPWTCTKLGVPAEIPDGVAHCAWSGENCIGVKCCNDANMKCFKKDAGFAGCKFNKPDDWDGTQLGEFRGWSQVAEPAPPGGLVSGTTLFCIAVQSPNPRVSEAALIGQMRDNRWSIFACDESQVMTGAAAERAQDDAGWKSVANTDIFIRVWDQIKTEGKFWNYDWTVKVDPDAVFFPDRLKRHLETLNVEKDAAVYIKNCDFKFGFMGSLEIFSMKAMERFHDNGDQCTDKIGHDGGEDFYMMTCMDALGVESMRDAKVLSDKYTMPDEKLVLDDVSHCYDAWTASFHPYRDPGVWLNCHKAASSATPAEA